jgi:hypothetical protein
LFCEFPRPEGSCVGYESKDHHNLTLRVPGKSVEGLRPAAHLDTEVFAILLDTLLITVIPSWFVENCKNNRFSEKELEKNFNHYPEPELFEWMFGWPVPLRRRGTKPAEEEPLARFETSKEEFVELEKRGEEA